MSHPKEKKKKIRTSKLVDERLNFFDKLLKGDLILIIDL